MGERWFGRAEMAERLGVSPKTLRVYEAAGLVHPARTQAGWRAYGPDDQTRLHQVLVLKGLGLTLVRIGELLGGKLESVDAVLALQQRVLETRRDEANAALALLAAARGKLARDGTLSPDDLTRLTRETAVPKSMTDAEMAAVFRPLAERHFTPAQQQRLAERNDGLQPRDIRCEWDALISEGDALLARGESPGSVEAIDLARRWMAQVNKFTGGDAAMNASSSAMYRDAFSDPATAGRMPFSQALWLFVGESYRRAQLPLDPAATC